MKASIITLGDELLIGQILDSNSAWIAQKLNSYGIKVESRVTVGDNREAIIKVIEDAMLWADLIVVTGGLGPTKDDITKRTLAEFFGCGMHIDDQVFEMNKKMLTKRGIEFNELNQSQAIVPDNCTVLVNKNGTAPGMWFKQDGKVLVSLPGVPFEMKALMTEQVLPNLKKQFNLDAIIHKTMKVIGIAESELALTIAEWEDNLPENLILAYLPGTSGIRLRLSSYNGNCEKAKTDMDSEFKKLEAIIPDNFLGYGEETTIEKVVAELLVSKNATLAVAESCTGGTIASRFVANAGASDYFLCGVVSYNAQAKMNILGVTQEAIEQHGEVSKEVAEQMALGIKRVSGADYAIATTGIAGPTGGSDEKPVGTVWIALAHPDGVESKLRVFGQLREQNIERATANAINMLRMNLVGK